MHRTFVGHIERGESSVTLATILRLCAVLNVEPNQLMLGLVADPRPRASGAPSDSGSQTEHQ